MSKKANTIRLRGQDIKIGEAFKIAGEASAVPVKLKTQVLTEQGKQELFQDILDALNVSVLGRIEEGNNVVLVGMKSGTYRLFVEKEDGTKADMGIEVTV